jgi:zinc D-Ala-D-Ala carboxypeptidase
MSTKLSRNFTLEELIQSPSAERWGIEEQFTPPQNIVNNLILLCDKVLQPIRDSLKDSIRVTSGYRCPRLNAKIGGAYTIIDGKPRQTSQHCFGQAADIVYIKKGEKHNGYLLAVIKELMENSDFKFDQCIVEFGTDTNPSWIHISFSEGKNRMQILRAYKTGKKTLYKPWTL